MDMLNKMTSINQDLLDIARSVSTKIEHASIGGEPCLCSHCDLIREARIAIARAESEQA